MDLETIVRKTADMIRDVDKAVYYFRVQDYLHGMIVVRVVLSEFETLFPEYIAWKEYFNAYGTLICEEGLLAMLQNALQAKEQGDNVLLADMLECQWLPFLISLQERYAMDACVPDTGISGTTLEYTSCGAFTLAIEGDKGKQYLHTNGNVYREARELAQSWFVPGQFRYVVFGLGLGYHIQALLEIDEYVEVFVVEPDKERIALAEQYGVPGLLSKIHIYDDICHATIRQLLQEDAMENGILVHYPSVAVIKNKEMRKSMEDYFFNTSSYVVQHIRMLGNFQKNRTYFSKEVGELQPQFMGKDVYVVAAGPSLGKNMEQLRNVSEGGIVLATGTVLRKLLNHGIRPDYVIITDSGNLTYHQIEGIEDCGVPLLFMATVYGEIPQDYQGEKYVIFQKDFPESEEYAATYGYGLTETGGSVTTTAAAVAVRLGCASVVFCGLDLAYTGGVSHTEGTHEARHISQVETLYTEDIEGKMVPTVRNFNSYRLWIEKFAKAHPEVTFIDATEGGAKVHGLLLRTLAEVVK